MRAIENRGIRENCGIEPIRVNIKRDVRHAIRELFSAITGTNDRTEKPFQRCNLSGDGVIQTRSPPRFLHLNLDNDDNPPPGYENVTPIARNDIPLVGHWCMKQLSIDNVSQSRGGYIRGVSQGRGNHLELR